MAEKIVVTVRKTCGACGCIPNTGLRSLAKQLDFLRPLKDRLEAKAAKAKAQRTNDIRVIRALNQQIRMMIEGTWRCIHPGSYHGRKTYPGGVPHVYAIERGDGVALTLKELSIEELEVLQLGFFVATTPITVKPEDYDEALATMATLLRYMGKDCKYTDQESTAAVHKAEELIAARGSDAGRT